MASATHPSQTFIPWVVTGFLKAAKACVCVCTRTHTHTFSHVRLFATPPGPSVPRTFQARILQWVPFPSPGYLPDPGMEVLSLVSPALARCVLYQLSHRGSPMKAYAYPKTGYGRQFFFPEGSLVCNNKFYSFLVTC